MEVERMGKVWTLGLSWGLLAWIPYFMNLPFVFGITLGLPVFLAGYMICFFEIFIDSIPDGLFFCLSLPIGVVLCWVIRSIISIGGKNKGVECEKERWFNCSGKHY
ncbi:hypothetical protein BBF96_10405 [Anoxybacter fermentans]|uniref:Uncharacterized protein n=1 Tax=Anoxybacter fermentans TaxID=1323375 RepID=A0A3Q9HRJ0_9FIRM|nr:hypothetical protein [Anoxybacter fermentans]AZR73759.1 hypothetical protein BBF96_10405 [Anoxybacter fermentans]